MFADTASESLITDPFSHPELPVMDVNMTDGVCVCPVSHAFESAVQSYTADDKYKRHLYCGVCFVDAEPQCGQTGQWQKYGDWRESEKKWVYICSGCSKDLWRLYSKGEKDLLELDMDSFYKDYMVFLKFELEKRK